MSVMWLSTHVDRGAVPYTGPVTGIAYVISPQGTPVHESDYEPMWAVLGEPCCGKLLPPFADGVRVFRPHTASVQQMKDVPEWLLNYKPDPRAEVEMDSATFVEVDGMADGWLDAEPPIIDKEKKKKKLARGGEGEE